MRKSTPLLVAGIIFLIMALVHLVRLVLNVEVIVSGYTLPLWVSVVGLIVAAGLSIWMLMARRSSS